MCLAVPVCIKIIEGTEAEVEACGVTRRVSLILTPQARPGDYVLLHAGYAISIISQQEAVATFAFLNSLAEPGEAS
jgi:hydrogenase expression/formation protein HypC